MYDATRVAGQLAELLNRELPRFPEGFFDSFEFTTTGNNLTHPLALGVLTRILWRLPQVAHVGVDVRFNCGRGRKIQPDLVGFDEQRQPVVFVDYESPNSSDARIPLKDIDAFVSWRQGLEMAPAYIVITTLPDGPSPRWQLRYTSRLKYNEAFAGRLLEVRENPYRFWYTYYRAAFSERDMTQIALLNINGRQVSRGLPS